MPPEEILAPEATQTVSESPSPVVEVPAETPLPEAVQPTPEPAPSAPEVPPAPAEEVLAPETAPDSAEATTDTQPPAPTGQIGGNDPLSPVSDPIPPAQSAPEPPSAAAPAQIGILHTARDLLVKARVTIQDRKRKKRDKIMEALTKKNKITNDEVEKLLHVSDSTAERYLSVLVKEGKIKQDRRTGAGVSYSRAP
ncbi:hypothetical protein A2609_02725 [Candidatus Kaiserbacteria bacterium RIFOXYD1_FULL_47_14]|uniref:HTH deoR-type domain-containing protein n=1 Tax=Candidatus Kaiserbacteria bacterium RIFOXYD1_FULL_47_14 TaxID=1798533 RepID=A0A1F6G7W7_9BACT|nr:MAG: hypothetical protein A2609_02725 [Candidatus Kaiserbacteria bacterium RIFOXYD1_FULL_47_14]